MIIRTFMVLVTLVAIPFSIKSQTLEKNATYIKTEYSKLYESTIRHHSLEKWNNDFVMVVYEINKQCDAIVELIKSFKQENTNVLFNAMIKWSYESSIKSNAEKIKEIKTCDFRNLLPLECDWPMVLYEYKKQVIAKSSF